MKTLNFGSSLFSLILLVGLSSCNEAVVTLKNPLSTSKSSITVSPEVVEIGEAATITLTIKDESGNPFASYVPSVELYQYGGSSVGTIDNLRNQGNGIFTARFTGVTAGTATNLRAKVDSEIVNKTLAIRVITPVPVNQAPNTPLALLCPTNPAGDSVGHNCTLTPSMVLDTNLSDTVTYVDDSSTCPDVVVNGATGDVTLKAPSKGADCVVNVKAFDGLLYSNAISATITGSNNAPFSPALLACNVSPYGMSNGNVCLLTPALSVDPDGDLVTYADDSSTCNDVVVDSATGSVTYTAPVTGDDCVVKVKAYDGLAYSNSVSSENVAAVNNAPVAVGESLTVKDYQTLSITLSGNDVEGSTLDYSLINNPSKGTLSGSAPNLIYTPNNCASGNDTLTFKVNDGSLDSNIATVNITITATGSIADPTIISSVAHMQMTSCTNRNFKLSQDLDFSGANITPFNLSNSTFDGQGFEIRDFNVNQSNNNYGLFNWVSNSNILNLTITDFNISPTGTPQYIGGLAATGWGSSFYNVHARNGSITGNASMSVGGLVGYGCNVIVVQSSTDLSISAQSMSWPNSWQGGLTGACGNGSAYSIIANSYTTDSVNGIGAFHAGGGSIGIVSKSFDGRDLTPDTTGWDFTNIWQVGTIHPELRAPDILAPKILKVTSAATQQEETTCFEFNVESQSIDGVSSPNSNNVTIDLFTNNSLSFYASQSDCESQTDSLTQLILPSNTASIAGFARVDNVPWGGFESIIVPLANSYLPKKFSASLTMLDTDDDQNPDAYDSCPYDAGPYWNNSCPTGSSYLYFAFDNGYSYLPISTVDNSTVTSSEFFTSSNIVSCNASPDGVVVTSATCTCSETSCTLTYSTADTTANGTSGYIAIDAVNEDGATIQNSTWVYVDIYE